MSPDPEFHLVAALGGGHDPARALERLKRSPPARSTRDLVRSAKTFQLAKDLETAINTALAVGAPLLLSGPPGTGKTQVAYYLSEWFGIPLFEYQVRSTSSAEDLKWEFDAVEYLHAAQDPKRTETLARQDFRKKHALWLAYLCETPCVLLIDEIDKAPRDFPNDLLRELGSDSFTDPDSGEEVRPNEKAGRAPIVVITSNDERRLPDAFLRRCVFHHLRFDRDLVKRAVGARRANKEFPHLDDGIIEKAIDRFFDIYDFPGLQKKPATAELLVWLAILSARRVTLDDLGEDLGRLPGLGALVKDHQDWSLLKADDARDAR